MQRQRGELVPIGDALSGMGGPVKLIRDATPQAVHHFTRFDQVNQLVSASEADPCQGRSKFGPLRRSKSRPVGEGVAVFVGRLERSLRSPFRAAQA